MQGVHGGVSPGQEFEAQERADAVQLSTSNNVTCRQDRIIVQAQP